MKRAFTCALVSLLAVASFAQTKKEFEAFLTKEEPSMLKGFANKDIQWFENNTAPEFTYTDFAGKTEKKKESLAGLAQMFDSADKIKAFLKRGAVTMQGSTGIVIYNTTYHLTMKPGPDKKIHVMTVKGVTKETFKKIGGKWLSVSIVETEEGTMLMDGKPIGG